MPILLIENLKKKKKKILSGAIFWLFKLVLKLGKRVLGVGFMHMHTVQLASVAQLDVPSN